MKYLLTIICISIACLFTSCKHYHDDPTIDRAILVYMAADNDLASFINGDINQMMEGSKQLTPNQKLLIFVDRPNQVTGLFEVTNGDTVRLNRRYNQNVKTSDPQTLSDAMQELRKRYPKAESYGLVLWGHATGWIIEDQNYSASKSPQDSRRKAYGYDQGEWMEIPDLAVALSSGPHLDFIFADCCAFQCIESAYELRHVTDYIIASAAEIPGEGAPYHTVIPALFSTADNFYEEVVNAYYAQESYGYKEPMSVIKTSELEDLATATHNALSLFLPLEDGQDYIDVSELIYYYEGTLFDMQDFILRYVTDKNAYEEWKRTFDKAVIYRTYVRYWMAKHVKFSDFTLSLERYGGVSMFIPQNPMNNSWNYTFYRGLNKSIRQMEWYSAARLSDFGW